MGPLAALTAAGAAVSITLAGAPAQATTIPDDSLLQKRLEQICIRAPLVADRLERLQPRLNGDAGTKGSLKWLAARVQEAKDAGLNHRANVLQRRLDRRTELTKRLPERLENLKQLEQECTAAGLPTKASS